ncbi:hypothetical protein GH714_024123 [Hevea brasiliensis]|uniref:MSP domain-containing protein n=1 Tax=Hevea brasiliensis TaxID=3981 RepID=A0A6A6LEP5_HEVBR|nr:hypothetical protein GH714_024123 [Hevea brasiliensis]
MRTQLLEIQPRELKFIFELKKQSSCAVQLTNSTYDNVAFKVKTTSPKKYCVRPNVGIILPKSTCEFIVTMQAPKATSNEKVCKDKFLIQSIVVPVGTTEKDITSNMFNKDDGKYIEEIKLKVGLISPPQSPVLSPVNEEFKKEKDTELKANKDLIDDQESKPAKDAGWMPNNDVLNVEEVKLAKDEDLKPENDAINDNLTNYAQFSPPKNEVKSAEFVTLKAVEELKFVNEIEEMKSKLNALESKLNEAMLRSRTSTKRVQVGFPLLFVVMVAFISILLGYLSHL